MKISNRFTGVQIFEFESTDQRKVVLEAIKIGADLRGANLRSADLSSANLRSANLSSADLRSADLSGANLSSADLSSADLRSANLRSANLRSANLRSANLRSANLSSADLRSANLRSANLRSADLKKLISERTILPDGDLFGWKKLANNILCKLLIPAKAERIGGLTERKCRAEFAVVVEGNGEAQHDRTFKYVVGETVRPDKFDPNPLVVCSSGIHFFITKEEAEAY